MQPILFSESATNFTSNGIGRLSDAISCAVTEERNGKYEMELVYPKDGAHYSDIGIRSIIVAKPSTSGNLQAFRVYQITKPIGGKVTIYAQHISYDLNKNVTMPFTITASASACANTLAGLKSNAVETCPFNFSTNVTTVSSYSQTVPSSIRSRLGGVEGSVLDQFGGEYEWDNFTVYLHRSRGAEKDITLRYGKNITDLEQEENIANTVTGVVPYWINSDKTESVTLTEKVVYSSNASRYSSHLTVPLDLSGDFQEKPTEAQLRAKANVAVNQRGFGLPKVSISLSFVNLADTEEYRDYLPLQEVNLCDTIKVQFEELGIDTTAEIVETEYDVLNEKYISIQVGSLKSTLATTINDMNASMASTVENVATRVYSDTSEFVDNATAWLTSSGGYVVAVKNTDGTWKELLFMDTNDIDTAVNVLRINENGIGFSSTGVDGPYTQAWTLDGKLVVGGTNVPSITCWGYQSVSGTNHTRQIVIKDGEIYGTYDGSNIFDLKALYDTSNSRSELFINSSNMTLHSGSDVDLTAQYGALTLGGNSVLIDSDTSFNMTASRRHINMNSDDEIDIYNRSGERIRIRTQNGGDIDIETNSSSSDINISAEGRINLSGSNLSSGTLTDSNGTSWEFTNGLLTDIY